MANELCVFCGQKPGTFRSTTVQCGATVQTACRSCEKELKGLDEGELCRRALVRGLAEKPELIRDRIEFLAEVEDHRPKCPRCGTGMIFRKEQQLDNTPMRDGYLSGTFCVLPSLCPNCGRYEFYDPDTARRSRHLSYLIWKDARIEHTV